LIRRAAPAALATGAIDLGFQCVEATLPADGPGELVEPLDQVSERRSTVRFR